MVPALSSRLILLSDLAREGEALRAALPWKIVPIRDAATCKPRQGAVATDVCLDDPQSVASLGAALLRHRPDPRSPLVFLLRTTSIFAHAQANALGATAILSANAAPADIAAKMQIWDNGAMRIASATAHAAGLIGEASPEELANAMIASALPPQPSSVPLAKLLGIVQDTIASLLASARKRQPIVVDVLHKGAEALVDAIRGNGIKAWVDMVRRYDDMTYQHVMLVAGFTAAFAMYLGFTPAKQHLLSQAALLHDIGKAVIPLEILNKPGPLTASEMELMRTHPARGYYMICHQPGLDATVLDVVFNHHEYLDGSGYPNRLRREQISEASRIVTICDIHAALVERRSYKPPMPAAESYAMLVDMGDKLDRGLVAAFRSIVETT